MAAALFDVNFLLALAWPQHQFHDTAFSWFARHNSAGWATCAVTQIGFIRLSSNRTFSKDQVKSPAEASQLLAALIRHPHHRFLRDIKAPVDFQEFNRVSGHQHVTDAYLVGMARLSNMKLVTFDRAIVSLAGPVSIEVLSPS